MALAHIVGIGRTRVGEHWDLGLLDLAVEAAGAALGEAGADGPTAVVVGNALGGALGDQGNVAAYVASRLGLEGGETHTVCDDDASGGSAVRLGIALIRADLHREVLVVGAEKTSDALPDEAEAARAGGLDSMREASFGFGPAVASGLGMQRYLAEHGVDRGLFFHLPRTAHLHASDNPGAFFPWELPQEQYSRAQIVAHPLNVCDCAPLCDGAAAVVLARPSGSGDAVRIEGSAAVTAPTGISSPVIDLDLPAATRSARLALDRAGADLGDISIFDLHDSSSFLAALSVEAVGLADRGRALEAAAGDAFVRGGPKPLWTFGGLKARGHAPGASGVYQIVEAALQLRGEAGAAQVRGASAALVQCLGSFGSTAVTHILRA